jgi:alkylation response protein AidB-like acyl-CoA dehydrogenase
MTDIGIVNPTSPGAANADPSLVLEAADYARFHGRASRYDQDNEFFAEDLDELRAAGYLRLAVPTDLGGLGLSVEAAAREQRRLAYWAPATALAVNMHLYWTGAAVSVYATGDHSFKWLLDAASDGAVFAAGHGERGNDVGLDDSVTSAVPQSDGGYAFTGRKTFTSLSPVWTKLGLHGRDDSDPDHPKIVHAFIDRDAPGVSVERTWDALGMRATGSEDTVLAGAVAAADQVAAVVPVGQPPPPLVDGIFQWYLPMVANVYFGVARRALDLAILTSRERQSLAFPGQTHAHKASIQRQVAESEIALDAVWSVLEKATHDLVAGADYGAWWLPRLFGAKEFATATARRVVDVAVQIVGAASVSRRHELERLYRDVRTGTLHPPNSDAVFDVVGRSALGLFP